MYVGKRIKPFYRVPKGDSYLVKTRTVYIECRWTQVYPYRKGRKVYLHNSKLYPGPIKGMFEKMKVQSWEF